MSQTEYDAISHLPVIKATIGRVAAALDRDVDAAMSQCMLR